MRRKQMFDKYDRPTIHHFLAHRKQAVEEVVEAAVDDHKAKIESTKVQFDFDGMPLNWEEREHEKMLDYKSFLAGDGDELRRF